MEKVSCIIFTLFVVISLIPSSVPISDSYRNYHQELVYPFSVTLKTPKPPFLKYDFFDTSNEQNPPMYPLFTPNTINQRPETAGQIEEYNKALAEEAEEKEQKENEASSPEYKNYDSTPHSTHYVNVRGGTYNYKYTL